MAARSSSSLSTMNESASFNVSQCKYFHPLDGVCYTSDQHLLDSIHSFLWPAAYEWAFAALYVLIFLAGVVGNALVCYAVWRNPQLRTTTNIFLVNLAVADFLVIVLCLPPSLAQNIMETWFIGEAMCKIVDYYQVIAVVVSVLTLTTVSVERWLAIRHPLVFETKRLRVVVVLVAVWVVAHVVALPRLFLNTVVPDALVPQNLTVLLSHCGPSPHLREPAMHFEIFLMVAFFLVPFCVMAFMYIRIALCLWSSANNLTEGSESTACKRLKSRRNSAKMLIIIVVAFFLCFLPVYSWNVYRMSNEEAAGQVDISLVTLVTHLLVYLNSAINPIIYNFMSKKFRRCFGAACSLGRSRGRVAWKIVTRGKQYPEVIAELSARGRAENSTLKRDGTRHSA